MTSLLWVVDRIEDGGSAVLLSRSGEERTAPLKELPAGVQEGDAVRRVSGEYRIDRDATERLRKEAEELRSSARRGPSGPLSL